MTHLDTSNTPHAEQAGLDKALDDAYPASNPPSQARRTAFGRDQLIMSGKACPAAGDLPERARFLAKAYETDDLLPHVSELCRA